MGGTYLQCKISMLNPSFDLCVKLRRVGLSTSGRASELQYFCRLCLGSLYSRIGFFLPCTNVDETYPMEQALVTRLSCLVIAWQLAARYNVRHSQRWLLYRQHISSRFVASRKQVDTLCCKVWQLAYCYHADCQYALIQQAQIWNSWHNGLRLPILLLLRIQIRA